MGEVHAFPTARKRPYNGGHLKRHPELPEGVVRLRPPAPRPIPSQTGLVAFHLLTAILSDMTLPQRHRIAEDLKRLSNLDPGSEARADAYELLLDLPWRMEPQ